MRTIICITILVLGTQAILPSYEEALSDTRALLKLFRAQSRGSGKLYSSSEVPVRVGLFRSALKRIVEINNEGLTWTAKLTDFAPMTKAEKQSYLGLNASSIEALPAAAPAPGGKRANNLDWVARGAVTPVRRQLGGTCWSYSATHSIEGAYAVTTGNLVELTPQLLIDCVYPGSVSLNRGGDSIDAFRWVQRNGVMTGWNDYRPVNRINRCNTGRPNRIAGARVTGFQQVGNSANDLEAALNISPVSTAFHAREEYQYFGNGVYRDPNCRSSLNALNHLVTAVGYTRNTFKIKNSWGTNWGNNGYGDWSRAGECGLLLRNIRVTMARGREEEE